MKDESQPSSGTTPDNTRNSLGIDQKPSNYVPTTNIQKMSIQ